MNEEKEERWKKEEQHLNDMIERMNNAANATKNFVRAIEEHADIETRFKAKKAWLEAMLSLEECILVDSK